jgi:hypothetical protein
VYNEQLESVGEEEEKIKRRRLWKGYTTDERQSLIATLSQEAGAIWPI